MVSPSVLAHYEVARRNGKRPVIALASARAEKFPLAVRMHGFETLPKISRQPDRPQYAWIEDVSAFGLRFVDYADKLARIDHTGWFTDDDGRADEKLRGAVWRLPSRNAYAEGMIYGRNPRPFKGRERKDVFIAGYVDPNNEGAAFVELRCIDDEREAAHAADRIAELSADTERDYRRASDARMRFEDLADEVATARRQVLSLLAERRALKAVKAKAPTICAQIRSDVSRLMRDIAAARTTRAELANDYGSQNGWNDF